jgi:hypothetical protein
MQSDGRALLLLTRHVLFAMTSRTDDLLHSHLRSAPVQILQLTTDKSSMGVGGCACRPAGGARREVVSGAERLAATVELLARLLEPSTPVLQGTADVKSLQEVCPLYIVSFYNIPPQIGPPVHNLVHVSRIS